MGLPSLYTGQPAFSFGVPAVQCPASSTSKVKPSRASIHQMETAVDLVQASVRGMLPHSAVIQS